MNMHYLLIAVVITRTIGDLLFKLSVSNVTVSSTQDIPKMGGRLIKHPAFWTGLLFAVSSAIIWTYALDHFDLSYAYPFLSICFVTIIVGGKVFFDEHIGMYKLVGLLFILVGSFFLVLG